VNLHEYQARALLKAAGIPVPDGAVATSPDEVESIAKRLGAAVVVKAQVHTGGRGKAGGVKLAQDPKTARKHAEAILGMQIKGLTVDKVLVVPAAEIASEAYLGIIMDRETGRSKGFGFVTMGDSEQARAAMEKLDGQMLDGRPLRVNEAQDRHDNRGRSGGGGDAGDSGMRRGRDDRRGRSDGRRGRDY